THLGTAGYGLDRTVVQEKRESLPAKIDLNFIATKHFEFFVAIRDKRSLTQRTPENPRLPLTNWRFLGGFIPLHILIPPGKELTYPKGEMNGDRRPGGVTEKRVMRSRLIWLALAASLLLGSPALSDQKAKAKPGSIAGVVRYTGTVPPAERIPTTDGGTIVHN